MSDNKSLRDGRDRSKIDLNDPAEVEYVHQQFPWLTHEEIREAIKENGPSWEKVTSFLGTLHRRN
jgi:hypothetical protein